MKRRTLTGTVAGYEIYVQEMDLLGGACRIYAEEISTGYDYPIAEIHTNHVDVTKLTSKGMSVRKAVKTVAVKMAHQQLVAELWAEI